MTHPRITFIGAGNMATSLIGGLLAQGIPASHIRASDPGAEQRAKAQITRMEKRRVTQVRIWRKEGTDGHAAQA